MSSRLLTARTPLAQALRCALFGGLLAGPALLLASPAMAQTPPAASAQLHSFNIAAGPLDRALSQFADQLNLLLAADARLTAGKTSPGLRGQYSQQQGLQQLLQGSGLSAQTRADGRVVLLPLPEAGADLQLSPITVTGQQLSATTEGTGSYTTGSTSTATKLPLSIRETPQAVSVLTRQQIDDLNLTTLDDAVQNITGLTMQKGYYTGDSGSFMARGFPVSSILLDGLPTSTGANGTFNADNDALEIYDRVEVVRGATGLTTGTGTPSAAINLVRKRPTADPQASITVSAGSWDNYRSVLDAAGPLTEGGAVRGRTVVSWQDAQRFYDYARDRNHQFYGILEADLTPDTLASIGFHYRKVDNDGILASQPTNTDGSFLEGLSRSTNLINEFDYWRQTDKTLFADLTQHLAGGWQLKAAAVWKRPEQDMLFTGLNRTAGVLRQSSQRYRLDNKQDSYDLSLTGPYRLFGREHELVLGASYQQRENRNWGGWAAYSWTAAAPAADPYNWDASAVPRPPIDMSLWTHAFDDKQKAVYAATRLQLADPLTLILGTRVTWYERELLTGSGDTLKINAEAVPYAGLVFDLDDNHSVYASWTEIFEPQTVTDQYGDFLEPITGTNYELGIKGEYFDGQLNASLATFLIKQQNRAVSDLAGPNPCPGSWGYCSRAAGEVESQGVEMEISGALTANWQLTTGYAFIDAEFSKDTDPANVGEPYDTDIPRHQFKLTSSHQLTGTLQRWRVGGSLYAQSDIQASDDSRIQQPGYATVGLHAAYQPTEQTEVRLNVNNLLDREYYQSLGWTEGGNTFGAPRNYMLSLRYQL